MKKIFFLKPGVRDVGGSSRKFPGGSITNGIIRAKLYFPDPVKGYYQGVRFDWSGNMPSLEFNGHQYFGKWFGEYHPEIHDVIMGPVEEFMSPDYADVKPGESFLKPGVGILMKPDDEPYDFHRFYPMLNRGKWKTKCSSDSIQYIHELNDTKWSYHYTKDISLVKDKAELVIEHSFRNMGKNEIETGVYDHNFFMFDNQPVGPGYTVTFPFNIKGDGIGIGELAELRGNKIEYLRFLKAGEEVFCHDMEGFGPGTEDYDIRIENDKAGTGVRITCRQPFLKLNFWCCPTTICPEPYITIKAAPGEEFKWKIRYEFYELK
jgi:hypothetical protein